MVTVDINSNLVSSKSGQMQLNPADPSGQSLASSEEGAGLGNLIRIHVSGTDKRGHQQDMRFENSRVFCRQFMCQRFEILI